MRDDQHPLDQPQSTGGPVRTGAGDEVEGVCGNGSRCEDRSHRDHLLFVITTLSLPGRRRKRLGPAVTKVTPPPPHGGGRPRGQR
ncbi:hypothetical protein [Ornithinimicrobium kibberense]|uniref:hypothetical protein n=1 Tax=Ornithinimicrobium kibberense TaxID=282060 RepID=UPI00360C7485